MNLRFAVLGSLEVRQDQRPVPVRGRREHVVLAMLLLADGGMVTLMRLVEAIWDADPPRGAIRAVRNCVSALRYRFTQAGGPAAAIETPAAGYRLAVGECYIDARDFGQQIGAARRLASAGKNAWS